jgi:hypothetical protein
MIAGVLFFDLHDAQLMSRRIAGIDDVLFHIAALLRRRHIYLESLLCVRDSRKREAGDGE